VAEPASLRGLVLAGGHSRRLGQDKAAVRIGGATQLERSVQLLRSVVADVRVAIRPDQSGDALRRQFQCVTDVPGDFGPAAGVLSAHAAQPDSAWLVLACDMPSVTADLLHALVAARDSSRAATAFRAEADGAPEPLCALYEPATLAAFQRQVEAGGSTSLRHWLAAADAVLLDAPARGALASINRRDDLARLAGQDDC